MIRENQRLLNLINVLTDGIILFVALPLAFWFRFYVMPDGVISEPLGSYMLLNLLLMAAHLIIYAVWGLYGSIRRTRLKKELLHVWLAGVLCMTFLLSFLFISREVNYSRITLALYFVIGAGGISAKRIAAWILLRELRRRGYNQKHILVLGGGQNALNYLQTLRDNPQLGYKPIGYVAAKPMTDERAPKYLGEFDKLEDILDKLQPDEVISAVEAAEHHRTPDIVASCNRAGIKLSLIPFYARYMSASVHFDVIGNIPLMNIRGIPLDNLGRAFCKRLIDIVGSLLLIIVSSPVMLVSAIGVRLSSPGPVIFKQERVGKGNKSFKMYKFRSMRVNSEENIGWSTDTDSRKTRFGAFLRKYSLDEFPQFFNVLKGDMSLVGPRPELPHFVKQFREEIPLYMVKHQVRPGITGWAQVNDLRGDTSIKDRIEYDIYYIEHWSLFFDIKILLMTVFKGKFKNSEKLNP